MKSEAGKCPQCGSRKYDKKRKSGKYECFVCGYVGDEMKKEGKCPYCGLECLDYEPSEVQDDKLVYPFTCHSCGKSGYEIYSLHFESHEDENHRPVWVKQ
jgi:DNA-directed RNA polymerase subunit RPC12/RpoP